MPLLDIIGVSSFNTSFNSCFVFMQKEEEEEEYYVWALKMFSKVLGDDIYPTVIVSDRELALMKSISIVFPRTKNLLCVWHIEKNVLCFKDKDIDLAEFMSTWTSLIQSPDELSYKRAWDDFEVKYKEHPLVINYIKCIWLPYEDKFVRTWTDNVLHLGNRVSSRAESVHSMLKKYLQVSTGDLRDVKEKICLAIDNQFYEIKAQLSSELARISHRFGILFYKDVIKRVSVFALDAMHTQYELAKKGDLGHCKGYFTTTMGLPCAHMIRYSKFESLHLEDMNSGGLTSGHFLVAMMEN